MAATRSPGGSPGTVAARSDAAEALTLLHHRVCAVAEAMGGALVRAASGPNIKERRDLSCAVFDERGRLLAQAAHIPVHLGALPAAVDAARRHVARWRPGDVVLLNDPYLGGSHLPDLTTVSPAMSRGGAVVGFVATRAHHADVGGGAPGSLMASRDLFGEGLVLPPVHLVRGRRRRDDVWSIVCANSRTPDERLADLEAQIAAQRLGAAALADLVAATPAFGATADALLAWSSRLLRSRLATLGDGSWSFEDVLDGDGAEGAPLAIRVTVHLRRGRLRADFRGTAPQVEGGLNAPVAVAVSAARYVAACLAEGVPLNDGAFADVIVQAPRGCLLNPVRPAAVAAGNVETSQRIVDVLLGALAQAAPNRIPAASQGTMNNLLVGSRPARAADSAHAAFAYYETMGGGGGASALGPGASGLQVHMTNTRNTPVEALELAYPLRVERYAIRRDSGGEGRHSGGDGAVRRLRVLAPARVTVVSERRARGPWGLRGGADGRPGHNRVLRSDGRIEELAATVTIDLEAGDAIEIASPGGGGWGAASTSTQRRDDVEDDDQHEHPANDAEQQGAVAQQDVLGRATDAAHLDEEEVAEDRVDHERHGDEQHVLADARRPIRRRDGIERVGDDGRGGGDDDVGVE